MSEFMAEYNFIIRLRKTLMELSALFEKSRHEIDQIMASGKCLACPPKRRRECHLDMKSEFNEQAMYFDLELAKAKFYFRGYFYHIDFVKRYEID